MDIIFKRRSIRKFKQIDVEQEKVDKLLRAAMQAPSALNQQHWELLVVRGEKNLEKLSKMHMFSKSIKNANLAIIVVSNKKRRKISYYYEQDLGALTQNILLEATYLGLGSCWYGVAPRKSTMEIVSKLFNLDDNLTVFSVVAIGYPLNEDDLKFNDKFDTKKVRYID